MIRGAIFDLDGTLVDSALDFALMRREMELPDGLPLLEAIAELDVASAERCWEILAEHERRGVERATLLPGVREFLHSLGERGLRRAVFTRNSQRSALATLARFELEFDAIACREDGPAKPDPTSIHQICQAWELSPRECVMIGDYRFDIEAGWRAGTHTVLYTGAGGRSGLASHERPDFTLASFAEPLAFFAWLDQIDLGSQSTAC